MKSSMIDSCTKTLKKLSEQEKNLIKKLEDLRHRIAEEKNKRNEAIAQKIASTIPDLTEDSLDKILDEYRKGTDADMDSGKPGEAKPEEAPAKEEGKTSDEKGRETAAAEGASAKSSTETGEGAKAEETPAEKPGASAAPESEAEDEVQPFAMSENPFENRQ